MIPANQSPHRARPAHMPILELGNRANIIFLTVCSKDRKALFAFSDVHQLLVRSWKSAAHWSVGRYTIMPNHLHLFCAPAINPPEPIRLWVKYWKALASRSWPRPVEHPVWQQDVWDTQLRRGESYAEKWEYVRTNPVRAGLISAPEDWPYQGELNLLEWHDE